MLVVPNWQVTDAWRCSAVWSKLACRAIANDTCLMCVQEAAVAALLPITRYSRLACQQVFEFLPSSTADSVSTQQQQQQQHLTATSDSPESPLLQGHQQQYGNQQQQQYAPALRRILQLMKQHDSRMRYLCACCVSNISRVGDSMDPVLQVILNAGVWCCRC